MENTTHTIARLPYYAHWQGQERIYDPPGDPARSPGVGSIIHLTVNLAGELRRLPFKVTVARRQRTDTEQSGPPDSTSIGSDERPRRSILTSSRFDPGRPRPPSG